MKPNVFMRIFRGKRNKVNKYLVNPNKWENIYKIDIGNNNIKEKSSIKRIWTHYNNVTIDNNIYFKKFSEDKENGT